MRVDIWSDVVCPFCYIGKKRLERVAKDAGVELEIFWHTYQIDPDASASQDISNTQRLAQKYDRTLEEVEEMQENIAKMAKAEGIDFQWQNTKAGNSFNAHRIIHLAQSKGLGNQAEEAFFHAYMTEGLAIGEREVVEEIASRIGLENGEVEDVLNSNDFAEFIKYDENLAREQLNVQGVPFFIFNQKVALAGAQPDNVLIDVLQKTQAQLSEPTEKEQN